MLFYTMVIVILLSAKSLCFSDLADDGLDSIELTYNHTSIFAKKH
jgi:hypothetical protein